MVFPLMFHVEIILELLKSIHVHSEDSHLVVLEYSFVLSMV